MILNLVMVIHYSLEAVNQTCSLKSKNLNNVIKFTSSTCDRSCFHKIPECRILVFCGTPVNGCFYIRVVNSAVSMNIFKHELKPKKDSYRQSFDRVLTWWMDRRLKNLGQKNPFLPNNFLSFFFFFLIPQKHQIGFVIVLEGIRKRHW